MTLIQKIFMFLLPASWAEAAQAESRQWRLRCECGYEISVWDAGGVRWKATGRNTRVYRKCPDCRRRRWFRLEKKNT